MDKINLTFQYSIIINRTPEDVFDFTQDFSKRTLWDKSIVECKLVSEFPERKAHIKIKEGMTATLEYKLFDRPNKTSLRMTGISSPLMVEGGGSWTYVKQDQGATLWTQTNTLSLKKSFIGKLLKRFVEKGLERNTIASMQNVKSLLEK